MKNKHYIFAFVAIFVFGLIIRVVFALYYPLAADEASYMLIAKHISELKEFPLFVPKAHYGGAFSFYIGALLFRLLGTSVIAFRSIAVFIYWPIYVIFSLLFAKKFKSKEHCLLVVVLLSLTPYLITGFTSSMQCNHLEMLALGSVAFYLLSLILDGTEAHEKNKFLILLSVLCGFGFWLSPGVIYYVAVIFTALFIKNKRDFMIKKLPLFTIFFLIGALPVIIYNFQYPGATLFRFSGRILNLDKSILTGAGLSGTIISQVLWRIKLIPNCFFTSFNLIYLLATSYYIFLPIQQIIVAPAALFYYGAIGLTIFKKLKALKDLFFSKISSSRIDGSVIYLIFVLWYFILYSLIIGSTSSVKLVDYNRYILPLYLAFPFLLSDLLLWIKSSRKALFYIALIFLILVNLLSSFWGLRVTYPESPRNFRKLTDYLSSHDLFFGYANEDTAYPINFITKEKMTYAPTLFMKYEERFSEYEEIVSTQKRVSYIINKRARQEENTFFENLLKMRKINYEKQEIYPFVIYYSLSKSIQPDSVNAEFYREIED